MRTNTQPMEMARAGGSTLEVHSIFNTIQGEGPFSGTKATFVRLAGCNLQCVWCDTEYTERKEKSIQEIVGRCHERLIVITGGEPMRQHITDLVKLLELRGHTVQIETNGTMWSKGMEYTKAVFVVSPKTKKIHKMYGIVKHTIKLLVGHNAYPSQPNDRGGDVLNTFHADYVLPLDSGSGEQNVINRNQALEYLEDHPLTKLQLQIHKIIGVA